MKLVLLALVGLAAARQVPTDKLSGQAMADYINKVQTAWVAEVPARSRKASLMDVKYARHPAEVVVPEAPAFTPEELAAIPDAFDARTQWPNCPTIGNIRDQSDCGSCWAFGAAEALSDRFCVASGGNKVYTLSADDLLSCCGNSCGYGCEGGYPIRAWNFFVKSGICTGGGFYEGTGCKPYPIEPCGTHMFNGTLHHHDCPTDADTPKCTKSCVAGYPTPYQQDKHFGKTAFALPKNVAAIQKEIMTNGPVEAAYTVYEDFMQYKSGVYIHTTGGVLGGHAVKILGWGVENGVNYWLVANSWNVEWGDKGFFKIRRGTDECGIEEGIVAGIPKL